MIFVRNQMYYFEDPFEWDDELPTEFGPFETREEALNELEEMANQEEMVMDEV